MKALKIILYIVLIFIAVILILGLIAPSEYSLEREVVVQSEKDDVYDYVKHLKNQDDWSVWSKMDPEIKQTYTGTDASVGFISAWEGNKDVGSGEQEIIAMADERIDYELRFKEPFESTSKAYIEMEAISSDETLVRWGFEGKMPYPQNVLLLFLNFEEVLGDQYQTGLTNLKVILEDQAAEKKKREEEENALRELEELEEMEID